MNILEALRLLSNTCSINYFSEIRQWDWLDINFLSSTILAQFKKTSGRSIFKVSQTYSSFFSSSMLQSLFFQSNSLSFFLNLSSFMLILFLFNTSDFSLERIVRIFEICGFSARCEYIFLRIDSNLPFLSLSILMLRHSQASSSMASNRNFRSSPPQSSDQSLSRFSMRPSRSTNRILVIFSRLQEIPKVSLRPLLGLCRPMYRKKQMQYKSSTLPGEFLRAMAQSSSSSISQAGRGKGEGQQYLWLMRTECARASLAHMCTTEYSKRCSNSCLMLQSSLDSYFWTKNQRYCLPLVVLSAKRETTFLMQDSTSMGQLISSLGFCIRKARISVVSWQRFFSISFLQQRLQNMTYYLLYWTTWATSLSVISRLRYSWQKVLKSSLSMKLSMKSCMMPSRLSFFQLLQMMWMSKGCTSNSHPAKMSAICNFAISLTLRGVSSLSMFRMLMICSRVISSQMIRLGSRQISYRALTVSSLMTCLLLMPRVSMTLSSLTSSRSASNSVQLMSAMPKIKKMSRVFTEQYTHSCKQISSFSRFRKFSSMLISSSSMMTFKSSSRVSSLTRSKQRSINFLKIRLSASMSSNYLQVVLSILKDRNMLLQALRFLIRVSFRARFLDSSILLINFSQSNSDSISPSRCNPSRICSLRQIPVMRMSMMSWLVCWNSLPLLTASSSRISSSTREQFSDYTNLSRVSLKRALSSYSPMNSENTNSCLRLFSRKKKAMMFSVLISVRELISSLLLGRIWFFSIKQCIEAYSLQYWNRSSESWFFVFIRYRKFSDMSGSPLFSIATSFRNPQTLRYRRSPFRLPSFLLYYSWLQVMSPCFQLLFSRPQSELLNSSTVSTILLVRQESNKFLMMDSLVISSLHSATVTVWNHLGWAVLFQLGSAKTGSLIFEGFCIYISKGQFGSRKLKRVSTWIILSGNLPRKAFRKLKQSSITRTLNYENTFSRVFSYLQTQKLMQECKGSNLSSTGSSSSLTTSQKMVKMLELQMAQKVLWSKGLFASFNLSFLRKKSLLRYYFKFF